MKEEIIAERIIQLDNLYSVTNSVKAKSFILSQMIYLARLIDPSFLEEAKFIILTDPEGRKKEYSGLKLVYAIVKMASASEWFYYSEPDRATWHNIALTIIEMDSIRSKLLLMLIERGLIKRFKEIPIAVADKESREVDSYVNAKQAYRESL